MNSSGDDGGGRDSRPDGVAVARFRNRKTAHEYGLVVLSMKLPYWLMEEDGRYVLYVPGKYEGEVREQLARYRRESRYWPPVERTEPLLPVSALSLWAYGLVLCAIFYATHGPGGNREAWFSLGRVDAARMLEEGEWYRSATALTLHADFGHLAGNLAGGALFAYFLIRVLGSGLGWLLILGSGILGNTVNVLAHAEQGHLSVGASTAVFGALGAVVGYQALRQYRTLGRLGSRRLWVPLAAGAVLLGFLGSGGERTDVLAHLWGFLAGAILVGLFAWRRRAWIRSPKKQIALGVLTLFVLAAAWLAAIGVAGGN